MNRLRQLKKSDWIAIALTGVLILIIAMPLSPKQSESESTAEQETARSGFWIPGARRAARMYMRLRWKRG